jgi:hypothetical protein
MTTKYLKLLGDVFKAHEKTDLPLDLAISVNQVRFNEIFPNEKPSTFHIGAKGLLSLTLNMIIDIKVETTPGQWVDDGSIYA